MATYTPLYPAVGIAAQTAAPSSPAHYSAGVATPLGSTTSVKVSFNSELRRFPFPISSASPLDAQYEPLRRALSDSFGVNVDGIQVRYVDDEGDTITVGSDAELFEAVRCAEGAILRLSMHVDASVRPRPPHPVPRGGMSRGGRRGLHAGAFAEEGGVCAKRGLGLGLQLWRVFKDKDFAERRPEYEQQYAEHLRSIKDAGLPTGPWVVAALVVTDGNVDLVMERLQRREERVKIMEEMYGPQLEQLRSQGLLTDDDAPAEGLKPKMKFMCSPKMTCLRLLMKHDGDVEKVAKKMRKWQEKRESYKAKTNELHSRFAAELKQLEDMGFTNTNCLIRLLNRCDGNVAKVIDHLEKRPKWCRKDTE